MKLVRNTLVPVALISCCTPFVMIMWYINTALDGSLSRLFHMFQQQGFFTTISDIWTPLFWGSATAWKIIAGFITFQLLLLKILPGKIFYGPLTPKGYTPSYKANGIMAFIITMVSFCLASFYCHLFSASDVYDHFGEILGALNIFSLLICLLLFFKGLYKPSSADSGTSGNLIFDYYWGTELYPVLAGVNLKMFINCRLGMMSWGVILVSFAAKQTDLYGLSNSMLISVALQMIYLSKFYIWETGYLASLDIMHDRAGFYICWGCLVWVPAIYTSPALYLVNHPYQLNAVLALFIFIAGTTCILINYFADRQRQMVRVTKGNCNVWGRKPKLTLAKYKTEAGEIKQNLLLSSGWWGVARHFHYIPEIAASFFWTVPALFLHVIPYFYVIYLTILLVNRSYRDEQRCSLKYGDYWQSYCSEVPYKLIPFVY